VAARLTPRAEAAAPAPLDPQEIARRDRNAFRSEGDGLRADNGHLQAGLDAWGFTFTPYLDGILSPDACLGFRLLEARRGDSILCTAPPEGGNTPQAQERPDQAAFARPGGVTEVYMALDFAVEQQFILAQPLPGSGDLVLTGTLSTTLAPLRQGPLPGAARFPLAGGGELTYGPAAARDGAGRETAVGMELGQGYVRLTVPGDWLAGAAYPVTMDPLLGTGSINITNDAANQVAPAVAASESAAVDDNHRYLVAWSDNRTDGNWHIYGQFLKIDGTAGPDTLYQLDDPGIAYAKQAPAVTYNTAAQRWLVVWQEGTAGGTTIIKGREINANGPPHSNEWHIYTTTGDNGEDPAVSFVANGSYAGYYLITWTDKGSDPNGDIRAMPANTNAEPTRSQSLLVQGGTPAQAAPAIAYDPGHHLYLTVWQQDQHIWGRTALPAGDPTGDAFNLSGTDYNEQAPDLAFNSYNAHFLIAWERNNPSCQIQQIYGELIRLTGGNPPYSVVLPPSLFSPSCSDIGASVPSRTTPRAAFNAEVNEYTVVWRVGTGGIEAQQVSNLGEVMVGFWMVDGQAGDPINRSLPAAAYLHVGDRSHYLVVWQGQNNDVEVV
jgi:hypothetical protein